MSDDNITPLPEDVVIEFYPRALAAPESLLALYRAGDLNGAAELEAKGNRDYAKLAASVEESHQDEHSDFPSAWISADSGGKKLRVCTIPGTGTLWQYTIPETTEMSSEGRFGAYSVSSGSTSIIGWKARSSVPVPVRIFEIIISSIIAGAVVKALTRPTAAVFGKLIEKLVQRAERGAVGAKFFGRILWKHGNKITKATKFFSGVGITIALSFAFEELWKAIFKRYVVKISIRNFTDQTWKPTSIAGKNHTLGDTEDRIDYDFKAVLPPMKLPGADLGYIPGIGDNLTKDKTKLIYFMDFFFTNTKEGMGLDVAFAVEQMKGEKSDENTGIGFNFGYNLRQYSVKNLIALDSGLVKAQKYYDTIDWREKEKMEIGTPKVTASTPTPEREKDEMFQYMIAIGNP